MANWLCGSICIVHLLCLCTTFSFLFQWPMHGSSFFLGHAIISITGILGNLSKHCTKDYINTSLEVVSSCQDLPSAQLQTCSCFPGMFSMTSGMGSLYPIVEVKNVTSELILLQSLCSQPSDLGVCRRTTHYYHHLLKINNVPHFRISEPKDAFLDHFWH